MTERMSEERLAELQDDDSNWEDGELVYECYDALLAERSTLSDIQADLERTREALRLACDHLSRSTLPPAAITDCRMTANLGASTEEWRDYFLSQANPGGDGE